MLVHSSTTAPTSGWRFTSASPAARRSRSAAAASRLGSSFNSTRVNSSPPSAPMTGASAGAPAARRCSLVSAARDTVKMPARLPRGSRRSMKGTCISEDAATGTPAAAAMSFWNSDRNPQLVVMPSAPSETSSLAAAMKASFSPCALSVTTRLGLAPRTTL